MRKAIVAASAAMLALTLLASPASADCVTKAAEATAGSESSAKWFALETMVQAVSWSLWPGFLSNGKVEGYTVKNEHYKCSKSSGGYYCRGQATFCKVGKKG